MLCATAWCLLLQTADAELVGHWPFDGNLDDVVGEAEGTFNGGQATYQKGWIRQAVWFDGVDDYVNIPSPTNPSAYAISAWVKPARTAAAGIITRTDASGPTTSWSHQLRINASGQFHHYLWVSAERNVAGTTVIVPDTWYHVVITAQNNGPMRLYVNGVEEGTSVDTAGTLWATGTRITVGSNSGHAMGWFQGLVDDIQIYDEALSAEQVQEIMKASSRYLAQIVAPEDGAVDVPSDAVASWIACESAVAHDVYFGTAFDDVNDAGRDDPRDVLISQGQAETEYDPASLEYGQTYYWRIDEVNGAPDNTVFKGDTWSFTVEPYAYPLTSVTATASSSQAGMGPENTVNGSGLNLDDQHSMNLPDMWMTTGDKPAWIQYEFDKVYKLHELRIWNSNQMIETFLGFGAKTVTIEYSSDGETWATLENVPEFAKATGTATYTANTTVDMAGVTARFVKLTIETSWGGMAQTGLSEVRFFYVPLQGFYPVPADGATAVGVETDLSWRPGREAASHTVYIGDSSDAVAQGTVSGAAVDERSFTPAALNYATTYYWKVDETGDAGTVAGDVWSFTTQEYAVIDDFESYNNEVDAQTTIWHAWIDGLTDQASGSQVGYNESPFAETTTVHSGKQAMPLIYSNTDFAFSETTRTFDSAQDWTARGVKTLSVHFAGEAGNGGTLYLKINNTKVVYDGGQADLAKSVWQAWNIDLSTVAGNMAKVTSLTIGIEGSGAAGTLYVDDIRLYPKAPEFITPVDPGNEGLVAYYTLNGNAKDSSGNKLDGVFTAGTEEWVEGHDGQALQFNGATGYVDLGNNEAMNLTEAMTIACWLRDDGYTTGWQAIFTKGLGWRLQRNGTQANLEWTCPPSPYLFSKSTFDDGEWHHVAGTFDSQSQAIYVDGVLDAEQTVAEPIAPTTYKVMIGSIDTLTERVWHGPIDEVRLYNRALSAGEVLWLADQTTPRHKAF
jgi:hypothetical protein